MHIIASGITNEIEYSCMYDANTLDNDFTKEVDGKTLYGFYGIVPNLNDAPAILWFEWYDNEMHFVEGELHKCCRNCKYVGKSGGGFFAECMYYGYQVNDAIEHSCDKFSLIEIVPLCANETLKRLEKPYISPAN